MSEENIKQSNPLWVGTDGWYQPYDYWMSICGLYRLYDYSLSLLGDIRGKRILDCGCGRGHGSVMLAKRGALVTAFDISEKNIADAREIAAANEVEIDHHCLSFEALDEFKETPFDCAFGACVLHHVDIERAAQELKACLKPGAKAVFVENSARNPMLMFARKYLVGSMGIPRYGDDDEYPLRRKEIAVLQDIFQGGVSLHFPDLLLFRLLDYYIFQKRSQFITKSLQMADSGLSKIPLVNRLGYFQVVEIQNIS